MEYKKLEGQSYTEIKNILETLNSAAVDMRNYKNWFEKVQNTSQIVSSQIENLEMQFDENMQGYENIAKQPSFSSGLKDGYVPREAFEKVWNVQKIIREIVSWKLIQENMQKIMNQKLIDALGEVHALDIERETLTQIKEMDERRNKLTLDIVNNKLTLFDEKFLAFVKIVQEDSKIDRKENISIMSEVLKNVMNRNNDLMLTLVKEWGLNREVALQNHLAVKEDTLASQQKIIQKVPTTNAVEQLKALKPTPISVATKQEVKEIPSVISEEPMDEFERELMGQE